MKEEKPKVVFLSTVLDLIMFKMYGVEDITLLLKLKKEKILFIIHGARMIKVSWESGTLNHKPFQLRLRI